MTKFVFLSVSLFFLAACATHPSRIAGAKLQLLNGECTPALQSLWELTQQNSDDQLLYLMEYGSALQICGDFQKSNQVFLMADKLSEQVDYHSVSNIAGATLLNEEMIQYKGDIFERLFINASAALNYVQLGQLDDAMVEIRRINEKYRKFSTEEKSSFELNSFSQYLSGLLYETDKKYDDACISYQAAYKLDPVYRQVALDALSACWRAKRTMEYELLIKTVSPTETETAYIKRKTTGEITLLYLQGLGPQKYPRRDDSFYPYLAPTHSFTQRMQIVFENTSLVSEPVYSVEKAAIATLEADYSALAGRRLAARVAKEVVADQIRQKDKTLGNLALLVMVVAERADLRNWTLLPQTLQVLRIQPPAHAKIRVYGIDLVGNRSQEFAELDLSLTPKKKIYVLRSIK